MSSMDIEIEERGNFFQQFITNIFVFCGPKFKKEDYTLLTTKFKKKLIFIPKKPNNESADNYIPCLFYRKQNSPNFLIFFHGNSEHIFQIENFGLDFRSILEMNVILVEYPGYSIYIDNEPTPKKIFEDSKIIYDWIKNTFKVSDNQIFICGRSLGTSPAIYLASQRNPKSLILISAFTSIKKIGEDIHLSIFVEEIFKSIKLIKDVKCSILLIHGEKDNLISYKHSEKLKEEVEKYNKNIDIKLVKRPNMTHNDFNLKDDILNQIKDFLYTKGLISSDIEVNNSIEETQINYLFKIPMSINKIIESKIFNINDFEFYKEIPINNSNPSNLIRLIDGRIALTNGSKILLYDEIQYRLNLEIETNENEKDEFEITTLFQNTNENLLCGTTNGNIFIYEIDSDEFKQINKIPPIKDEIYKIDTFFSQSFCLLSKNFIQIYDNISYEKKLEIQNNISYTDILVISENKVAFLKKEKFSLCKFEENTIKNYIDLKDLEINGLKNTLIGTNTHIIIGGIGRIYYFNYVKSAPQLLVKKISQKENEEIIFMNKIHDELFLASTKYGTILQIIFNENGLLEIVKKNFTDLKINSLILKNYKIIIFSEKKKIKILSIPKIGNENNCKII